MTNEQLRLRYAGICHAALRAAAAGAVLLFSWAVLPGQTTATAKMVADRDSTAILAGLVRDSLGRPVTNATVSEVGIDPMSTTTDSAGRFRLVGIRAGHSRVEVRRSGYAMLGFDFEIAPGITVELELTLLPAERVLPTFVTVDAVDSLGIPGRWNVVEGTVTDSTGRPLSGVSVQGMSTELAATTGEDGRFALRKVAPGLHFLRLRKLGHLPEYAPLRVTERQRVTLRVVLRPASGAPMLAGVTIREDARMAGFFERRRRGGGIFVTREDLEQKYVFEISDALRGRKAVDVRPNSEGDRIIVGRRSLLEARCPLGLLIDGMPFIGPPISIDRLVTVKHVRAMEVYTNGASVPLGFQQSATDCGAILIWTR